jgi:hypothetical protein
MKPPRKERPLSFNQVVNCLDRSEVLVTHAYQSPSLSADVADVLLRALREMRRVLARAGRRPEHLRPR